MLLLLAPASVAHAQTTQALHIEAVALAHEGQHAAALAAFERLAADNPHDYQARLWAARLHGWMGHRDREASLLRALLRDDPGNVAAMTVLGSSLVTTGRVDEGLGLLATAESASPGDPDVAAALGRAHRISGHPNRAFPYLERAARLDPSEENRIALEQARVIYGNRFETNTWFERFDSSIPETRSTDMSVSVRVSDRLRLSGRGQVQRKFAVTEQRGGPGLELQVRPDTMLAAQFLVSPGALVLPTQDLNVDVTHAAGPAEWLAGYRFVRFDSVRLSVIAPGVTWYAGERNVFSARYFLARSDFDGVETADVSHSAAVRASHRVARRVWIQGGYSRGTESFDTLSIDRIGRFRADTASAGLRFDLPSLTTLVGAYEHQWRTNDVTMARVTFSLSQRF